MAVILFYPRFHGRVIEGTKRQTIRLPRKRPVVKGEGLSLRGWEGAPYRSKQTVLREARCVGVDSISIRARDFPNVPFRVEIDGVELSLWSLQEFARADGFEDLHDMARFWAEKRPLPFNGVVIHWG